MKITFVTFHNWETKRMGGFHKFAEAFADAGHEVVFFSFARPYYIKYKHEERLNALVLGELSEGKKCTTEKGNIIMNCTWPTLRIPMPLYKYMPRFLNHWCNTHSLTSFKSFARNFLNGTDIFVFESCEGVELFDKIKKCYPQARYFYRPSDPLMIDGCPPQTVKQEIKVLKQCDMTFIVNQSGLNLYKSKVDDFDNDVKYTILSNGVDVEKFLISYPRPKSLEYAKIALYIGAREPEWNLILKAANEMKDVDFVIVCPETIPEYIDSARPSNFHYIPGVTPQLVPVYVTNADVIIIPNPTGSYKIKPWGITAKYYQAMAANKRIVAYEDTEELCDYGIPVAYSYEDFIKYLKIELNKTPSKRTIYNLDNKEWSSIVSSFIETVLRVYNN